MNLINCLMVEAVVLVRAASPANDGILSPRGWRVFAAEPGIGAELLLTGLASVLTRGNSRGGRN